MDDKNNAPVMSAKIDKPVKVKTDFKGKITTNTRGYVNGVSYPAVLLDTDEMPSKGLKITVALKGNSITGIVIDTENKTVFLNTAK